MSPLKIKYKQMKSKLLLSLVICLFFGTNAYAQDGRVEVKGADVLDIKIYRRSAIKDETNKMRGYTVMLYFGADRKKAEEIKAKFYLEYYNQNVPVKLSWEQPNFKVFAGRYRTAIEAQHLISRVKNEYPNVMLIRGEIDFPKL